MNKYIKIIAQTGLMISMISSCKKSFLHEDIYSAYAPETLKDSLGFEAAITGLSNHLSTFFSYSDQQGWPCVWQVGTDIAVASQPQGIEVPYYNYGTLGSTDLAASYTWSWAYKMINNTNIIITNVEDPKLTGMGSENKNSVDAEARFYRAYAYNILATCFGEVPIITAPLAGPKTDFFRASLDSVNAIIEKDLLFAAANLPDIDNVKTNAKGKMYGRANKAMAQQLLAEAYLRMSKPDLAEALCTTIIGSGKFSLIKSRYGIKAGQAGDAFSDMFWYGNQRRGQGNTEAIWVMEQENPNAVTGGITNNPQQRRVWGAAYYQIAGMIITDSLGGRGICRLRLSNWVIYNLYDAGDMRNSPYNLRRQFYYNDPSQANYKQPVPYAGPDTLIKICPHTTKWFQFDPNDVFGFAMVKDFILMRLGETYLLLAEAQLKQNKTTEAAATLTTLRARSNASTVTAGQVTMDLILDERARELIGEENRRMTLMRTGTLVRRTLALNGNSVLNPITGLTKKNLLMPVPQSEIDLNKDADLGQNDGY